MKAFSILYLTLAVICIIFLVAGLFGAATTNQNVPGAGAEAVFFMSWVPISALIFSVLSLAFWIWGLVHLLKNTALQGTDKIVWILVLLLLNALGALLYFFLAPDPKLAKDRVSI